MKILEAIWEYYVNFTSPIFKVIENVWNAIQYIADFISSFDTISEIEPIISGLFPTTLFNAFSAILSFYIGIRILRFITFQG